MSRPCVRLTRRTWGSYKRPPGWGMAFLLTDADIRRLIAEPKVLPPGWRRSLRPRIMTRLGGGHSNAVLEFPGKAGSHFAVHVRVNRRHRANFSVVLSVLLQDQVTWVRLRR